MATRALQGLEKFSKLLDTQFRIPFTSITFGVDFIVGLIPYGGDILGFLFSAGMVITMAKYGVSGQVIGRMLLNILLDTVIGSIPILGDLFDLWFKSNRRNYELLEEHYEEGEHQGSIWRVLIPLLLVLILIFGLMLWLMFAMARWVAEGLMSLNVF